MRHGPLWAKAELKEEPSPCERIDPVLFGVCLVAFSLSSIDTFQSILFNRYFFVVSPGQSIVFLSGQFIMKPIALARGRPASISIDEMLSFAKKKKRLAGHARNLCTPPNFSFSTG